MDLLKAYVQQVVSYHPATSRDELFAEIYDEICEEYTDLKLDNPTLSEAEFLDVKKLHPMKYATQLAAGSSAYLIGPQLYFSFISALKIGTIITVVIHTIIAAIIAVQSENLWGSFLYMIFEIPSTLLWVGIVILTIFTVLEKSGQQASWLDSWQSSNLSVSDDYQKISHGELLFDFVTSTIGLLWVLELIKMPTVLDSNKVEILDWVVLLPNWFWFVVIALLVSELVFSIVRLSRHYWTQNLRLITITTNVIWLAMIGFALSHSQIIDAIALEATVDPDLLKGVNFGLKSVLAVVMLIISWDTITHIWRTLKNKKDLEKA